MLRNHSASMNHTNKSPIARIRERSARHLKEFGSLKSQRSPAVNDTPKVPQTPLVIDTLPHDVSIVDLVSKSTDYDGEIPQTVNVELPQFASIVDLVSMSQDEGSENNNTVDKSSDINMNYSDDNDDPIHQQQIQSIVSGLYQAESTLSQQQSGSFGGTPTSINIRRTTGTYKGSKK